MHIALFGGSFDPPHLGHQRVAEHLLQKKIVDQVWFVPVKQHPFGKEVSADEHRLAMLQSMIQGSEDLDSFSQQGKVRIEKVEIEKPSASYSYQTLQYFRQKFPQDTFSWVIGADNLIGFQKWYHFADLLQEFVVYLYPRVGYSTDSLLPGMMLITQVKPVSISSSEVRQKVKLGESIVHLVQAGVAEYISEKNLYQENR